MNYSDFIMLSALDSEEKFDLVLEKLYKKFDEKKSDTFSMTFTKKMLADGDRWLIQVYHYNKKEKLTFHRACPMWIEFEGDEPILLENVPESFLDTLIINL